MTRSEILQIAKPILFNTDMVRAIQNDRKTVTRRVMKPQPTFIEGSAEGLTIMHECFEVKPPCKPGDILYVRETWAIRTAHRFDASVNIMFRAGGRETILAFPNGNTDNADRRDYDNFLIKWDKENGWHPSIHMPKEVARIFLRVKDVRVERLQDMTHDGPMKEGIHFCTCPAGFTWKRETDMKSCYITPMGAMMTLWNSTIPEKDLDKYGWDANPWVWVIEFERVEVG